MADESEDVHMVVCMPVRDADPKNVSPDSIVMKCEGCGERVLVSPTTQRQIVPMKLHLQCARCALEELKASEGVPRFGVLPGQKAEVLEAMGVEVERPEDYDDA